MALNIEMKLSDLPEGILKNVPERIFFEEAKRTANENALTLRKNFIRVSEIGVTSLMRRGWRTEPARKIDSRTVQSRTFNSEIQALVEQFNPGLLIQKYRHL